MLVTLFNKVSGLKISQYSQTPIQVFSCEYCASFKNAYFEEHLRMSASAMTKNIRVVSILPKQYV